MAGGFVPERPLEGQIIPGVLDGGPVEIHIWDHPFFSELAERYGDPFAESSRIEEHFQRYFHLFDEALKATRLKEP